MNEHQSSPGKPTRVLLFTALFPHAGEPTLGIFVENRLRNLLKDEHVEATVVAPVPWFPFRSSVFGKYGRAAKAPMMESKQGYKVYHPRYLVIPKIGMRLTPYFLAKGALRCIRKLLAKGETYDLIDAHYLYPDAVAAQSLGEALDVPFVATARGSDVTEIGLMPGPKRSILKMASAAGHLITVSNNLRDDLIKMGVSAEKITTLRNGVDLQKFHPIKCEEIRAGWDAKGPVMLFAGWLIPRKRVDLVLEVTKRVPQLTTVIVGDGPLKSVMIAKAQSLGIWDRVRFVGQKKPDEMPVLFSAADLLILPSDREGWANVLLEAMACGTPVVTRRVGSAPDLVTNKDAGRVVDSENPDALAEAVEDLIAAGIDPETTRAFAEDYGWQQTSAGQAEIFDTVINQYRAEK